MSNFMKKLLMGASCLMLTFVIEAQANSSENDQYFRHKKNKTCNSSNNHSSKYVGVYYRSDLPGNDSIRNFSQPIITLNEDGTAIVYFGEALVDYVTDATISPTYGNWKEHKHKQIVVETLGFSAQQNPIVQPPIDTFGATRSTLLIDFSQSLNSPQIIARALVDLTGVPSSDWLKPNAGTLINNAAITPRQLKRICASASDLTRSM